MIERFNVATMKLLRRKLRRHMTPAETILWTQIRRKQLSGYQFKRQYSIDRYIVDFYCPQLKLVIEVDGDSHCSEWARRHDAAREKEIAAHGIKILRFTNNDVYSNLKGVVEAIMWNLNEESLITPDSGD